MRDKKRERGKRKEERGKDGGKKLKEKNSQCAGFTM